ncbi:MAG: O-antigen ligase family protein [Paracoccaceae bacterium]
MIIANIQVFALGLQRAQGDIGPIGFVHLMAMGGGITAVWLFCKAKNSGGMKYQSALLGWFILLILSVHLTGTRGAIIVFFPLLIGLAAISLVEAKRVTPVFFVLTICLIFLSVLVFRSGRFGEGVSQISQTLDDQKYAGSVGQRFGMWEEAWKLIKEKPLIGHGLFQFNNITELPTTNPIQRYNHVHNQFLDVWMKAGIGGLIFFVSILGLPFVIGIKLFIRNIAPEAGANACFYRRKPIHVWAD